MTTPEEELEAVLWSLMSICEVTCPKPLLFIDGVTSAAKTYAAKDSEILTAARREVLHRDSGPQGQTPASGCGGDGGAAHEPNAPRSTAAGPSIAAVGGATLSTGPGVPARGQGSGKSHPQPVDKP